MKSSLTIDVAVLDDEMDGSAERKQGEEETPEPKVKCH